MMKSRKTILAILFLWSSGVFSQNVNTDDPIAALLDSLISQKIFDKAFTKPIIPKQNKFNYTPDSIPWFDDYTFQARLAKLDANSPFDLVYNDHVRDFIKLYALRKRESVSRMMGVSQLYYPMFEEVFDRYNIPLELKHLAVIESALIPYAKSRAGAMGLWQFMYPTGKMFGLNVNSYIDLRCDPYKATVAAAEYLKSLYSMFNDWQMVLAAYNAGPGTISKAIRRSGGKKTYWEIRPYLPQETQGYVPAFIAANYVMNYAAEHNIYPAVPKKTYFEVDTVVVKEYLTFDQISQALDIEIDDIQYFNPQYRKAVIPSGGHSLCLPKAKIGVFLTNEQEIYAAVNTQNARQGQTPVQYTEVRKIHVVKAGEKLSTIAAKYSVSVADLKSWNYIGKSGLKPGKKLTVYISEKKPDDVKLAVNTEKKSDSAGVAEEEPKKLAQTSYKNTAKPTSDYHWYKVKSGDNLSAIASKYKIDVNTLKATNNLKNNDLKVGQMLKIKK